MSEKRAMLGDVEFSVTTEENVTHNQEVTDRPVEDLGYISDHVKPKPVTFSIEGIVVGDDAWPKLKTLREYCKGKKTYVYKGRNIMSNVVIENLTTNHGKQIRNGYNFTMDLKIIKQAKVETVISQGDDPVQSTKAFTKVMTSGVKNMGKTLIAKGKADALRYEKFKEKVEVSSVIFGG